MADGFEAISGGGGADIVTATFVDPGTPWEMVVDTGPGPDVVVVTIQGGSESEGSILLFTGAGDDEVVVDSWAPSQITAGDGADRVVCGWGSDVAALGAGSDSAWCRKGADVVRGGAGPDVLRGGHGADVMRGGSGRDVCYSTRRDRVTSCAAPG